MSVAFLGAVAKAKSRKRQKCAGIAKYAVATQVQPNVAVADARNNRDIVQQRAGLDMIMNHFCGDLILKHASPSLAAHQALILKCKRLPT